MGHTNSTANLSLPQFIGTDKPTWLGDVNGAFLAIDGYAGTNDAAVAAAVSDATAAITQASNAVNTANTANTTAGNASTVANNALGVANTANAIAGTVDSKVGLLADLNTPVRTSIVDSINNVFGYVASVQSVTALADGVKTMGQLIKEAYDNLAANVGANTVQIIDLEVIGDGHLSANDTSIRGALDTHYTFKRVRPDSTADIMIQSIDLKPVISANMYTYAVLSNNAVGGPVDQTSVVPVSGGIKVNYRTF